MRITRLAAVVTHPIQYFAPLFQEIARQTNIDLTVFYEHDHGVRNNFDPGFGHAYQFDVPLLEGYRSEFITTGNGLNRTVRELAIGLPRFANRLRVGNFDWVWVHGYVAPSSVAAILTAKASGMRLLLRGESNLLYDVPTIRRSIKNSLLGQLIPACDALAFIGQENRRFYEAYGALAERLFFAPYSIDNARFAAQAKKSLQDGDISALRNRVGLPAGDVICIFVGKLIARKRPLDLVQALARLPRHYFALFVGEGEMRPQIEALLRESGVKGLITGFVNQTELPAYYMTSDMLVLPSEQETWGLVANEAMACGKPIVLSNLVGSSYDLVDTNSNHSDQAQTGRSYPCGDINALAMAIVDVDNESKANLAAVEQSVLNRIARYDISQTAKGIIEAISSNISKLKS